MVKVERFGQLFRLIEITGERIYIIVKCHENNEEPIRAFTDEETAFAFRKHMCKLYPKYDFYVKGELLN